MTETIAFDFAEVEDDVGDDAPASRESTLEPLRVENPTRPALETLARDQRELISSWLSGFSSRRDVLLWSHEATVATLGQLPPEWHVDRLMSLSELSSLLVVEEERRRWIDEDVLLSYERAREWRLAVASRDLVPACQDALRRVRWSAVEYADDDDADDPTYIDVDDQEAPAMRPGLEETANRQRWVVTHGLDGFGGLEDIVETWIPVAIHASYGELDEDLAAAFWSERPLRQLFIHRDDRAARFFRESFLATEFLPAFNTAIEQVADRAGEAISGGETTDHSAVTYPST
ncbi:hypothetical protein U4E84_09630 [Halorubrum sp. AD140]|uniref:hypothetical protein n=1 Tax=Halorubrum sp. AD140 TaxID=3050073 RepID=UPI002ACC7765|nr:hypothetical protein [Halorubrum sp. AD140]MDZ5811603.1 hypothetical protein [Halorubrum sp. AD140]